MRSPIFSMLIVALLLTGLLPAGVVVEAADMSGLVDALLANPVLPSELPPGATVGKAELVEGASPRVDWFGTGLGATWINVPMQASGSPAVARAARHDTAFQYAVFPSATEARQALLSSELQTRVERVTTNLGETVIGVDQIDQQMGLDEPALRWVAAGIRSGQDVWGNSVTSYSFMETAVVIVAQSGNVLIFTFLWVEKPGSDPSQIDPTPTVQFVAELALAGVHQVTRLASPSGNAASGQSTSIDETLGIGLGGSQESFEAKYPAPDSTDGATDFAKGDQYAVSGYKSVSVYWHGGYSAHIVLNAKSGWTSQKAVDIANRWLPSDFKTTSDAQTLSDGSVLALGHSAALAKRFSAGTYARYKVGGKQGDLRVVFIPAASGNTVGTVDIAIGTGKVLAASTTTTNASTPAANNTTQGSTSEATYLKTVRTNVDALTKSMDDFNTIMAEGSSVTDAEYQQFRAILVDWKAAPGIAAKLTPPSGLEDLQQAYEAAANDLSGASIDLTNYLSNGGQDQTLLTSARDKLNSAKSKLQQCDQLLAASGA